MCVFATNVKSHGFGRSGPASEIKSEELGYQRWSLKPHITRSSCREVDAVLTATLRLPSHAVQRPPVVARHEPPFHFPAVLGWVQAASVLHGNEAKGALAAPAPATWQAS